MEIVEFSETVFAKVRIKLEKTEHLALRRAAEQLAHHPRHVPGCRESAFVVHGLLAVGPFRVLPEEVRVAEP